MHFQHIEPGLGGIPGRIHEIGFYLVHILHRTFPGAGDCVPGTAGVMVRLSPSHCPGEVDLSLPARECRSRPCDRHGRFVRIL